VLALLKRFLIWRVNWKWYLAALLLMPALQFLSVILNAAFTQTTIDFGAVFARNIFGENDSLAIFVLPFFLIDFIANGEEMGWRGYVLPRLQAKSSALISSLILGVIWGLWHLPKFLAPGNDSSFLLFMLDTIVKAVLYTWLYNNTGGSLLLVTLFHAASNTGGVFLPVSTTVSGANAGAYLIQIGFEIIAALIIIVYTGAERLSRTEPKQIQQ
jgi:membrane protease YdiL (CAAX protease family)